MTDSSSVYIQQRKSLHFSWIPNIIFKPKIVFSQIIQNPGSWFTPMLVLSIAILTNIMATGYINQQAALNGIVNLPQGFEYWAPEQQNQFYESLQVRQGPVFLYAIPALASISSAWIGWAITSGMLHLVLTLLGGRGETNYSLAIVSWSTIPIAIRSLARAIYIISTHQLITTPGLSGFAGGSLSASQILWTSFLSLIDIYLVWQILLMILGVKLCTGMPPAKSFTGVLIVMGILILLQVMVGYFTYQIQSITIVRPFFI